ncbi:uncharacterized protein [Mytilus edulis]|uniref:uncharacterized protein n=1 Tax=Mytilus edulis TaxID=6550 RepID=UPI0039EF30CC
MRAKLYRYSLSEEKRKKSNELAKYRMQMYRARLKEKKKTEKPKVLTRREKKKKMKIEKKEGAIGKSKKENHVQENLKSVSKKTLTSKSVMTRTTKKAHELYSEQKNSKKISRSTFRKLRLKTVLTANKTQLRQCLCEYCTNIELKLNAFKGMDIPKQYKDVYDLQNDSLCKKVGKYHNINCIERECQECGISKLRSKLHGSDGKIQKYPL